MIIQNIFGGRHHRHQFHVPRCRPARAKDGEASYPGYQRPRDYDVDEDIAKVSSWARA